MPKKETEPLLITKPTKNKAAKEKGVKLNADIPKLKTEKDKIKKTEEKKTVKRETEQMNYMKDIAKNFVAKKNNE